MLQRVLRLLVCPSCRAPLDRDFPTEKVGGRARMAELPCRKCKRLFTVQEGVGLFASTREEGLEWRPDPGLLEQPPDERRWAEYLGGLPPEVPRAYDAAERALVDGALEVSGLLIDLATCRGHVLRPLAAKSGAHQLLLGTDPEVSRLYATQAALRRERHYTNVSLIEMDGGRWPVRDAGAAGAMSFYGPSILPSGRKLLREAARALRPGAPLIFATLLTRTGTLTLRQASLRGMDELLTETRLRQALSRSGFQVETWEVLAEGRSWDRTQVDPMPAAGDPWQHVLVRAHRLLRRGS